MATEVALGIGLAFDKDLHKSGRFLIYDTCGRRAALIAHGAREMVRH